MSWLGLYTEIGIGRSIYRHPLTKHNGIRINTMIFYFIFLYTLLALSGKSGHLIRVRLQQLQEQRYSVLQVYAGSVSSKTSVIHRTLTWTAGYSTCVRDHSYECMRIHTGLGTPTTSQHYIFDSKKLSHFFIVLLAGFEPRVFGSRLRRSTDLATPSHRESEE